MLSEDLLTCLWCVTKEVHSSNKTGINALFKFGLHRVVKDKIKEYKESIKQLNIKKRLLEKDFLTQRKDLTPPPFKVMRDVPI